MLIGGFVLIVLLSLLMQRTNVPMMNLLEECGTFENEDNKNIILSIPATNSSELFIFQNDISIDVIRLSENGEKIDKGHKFSEIKGTVERISENFLILHSDTNQVMYVITKVKNYKCYMTLIDPVTKEEIDLVKESTGIIVKP